MHHSGGGGGGVGYGSGPQERVHQVPRTATQTDKYPFEGYQGPIPDCCAAAAAVQDPYPRPPSGYDGRCYDEYHRTTPYQDDSYSQTFLDNAGNEILIAFCQLNLSYCESDKMYPSVNL
ncbi:hypothetical protein M0804_009678 [Polistes exclamans]|nr:hypothetical protein M0804_009678 [Polistes exclamans]